MQNLLPQSRSPVERIPPPPQLHEPAFDAAQAIARRFGLSLITATVVAELAGLASERRQ